MDIKKELEIEFAERHAEFKLAAENLCKDNLPNATDRQKQFILDCVMMGAGIAIGGQKRFMEKLKEKSRAATEEDIKRIQEENRI